MKKQKEYLVKGTIGMMPIHPGQLLREEVLPELRLSVSEFSRRLGVSRQIMHRILSEVQGITPEMALRIGTLVGNGPDLWLSIQQQYDLWHTRQTIQKELTQIHRYQPTA